MAAASSETATLPASRGEQPSQDAETTPVDGCGDQREACCGLYHRAVELVGKRWSGAIVLVVLDGPVRFSELRELVPDISDRLLSERLKELETEGIVSRRALAGASSRVEYGLTAKGLALEPAVRALKSWAHDWLD